MNSFLLAYKIGVIWFNVYVIANDWIDAKSHAPKGAKNINAVWMP